MSLQKHSMLQCNKCGALIPQEQIKYDGTRFKEGDKCPRCFENHAVDYTDQARGW